MIGRLADYINGHLDPLDKEGMTVYVDKRFVTSFNLKNIINTRNPRLICNRKAIIVTKGKLASIGFKIHATKETL